MYEFVRSKHQQGNKLYVHVIVIAYLFVLLHIAPDIVTVILFSRLSLATKNADIVYYHINDNLIPVAVIKMLTVFTR